MKALIADDHSLLRDALKAALQLINPEAQVYEAVDWQQSIDLVVSNPDLDIALVDLNMPGMAAHIGLNKLIQLSAAFPVVVISASENINDMQFAFKSGAAGFISKNETTPVILNAIKLVLSGGIYIPQIFAQYKSDKNYRESGNLSNELTPRQLDVLRELVHGKTNKEIASTLDLSTVTVKIHISAIFRILQVGSRMQAIERARELNLA